jgi:hypothetical protein
LTVIVVSFGINRSGSTLAFEMAKAVLELNGYPQQRLEDDLVTEGHHINFIRQWTDAKLARLLEATEGSCLVIKTHGGPFALSPAKVCEALDAGELLIHVVFRDPRDTIVSLLEHDVHQRQRRSDDPTWREIRSVDAAIRRVGDRLEALRHWGSYPSLKLQYERFAFDRITGPQLIADDLGLPVDPDEVWEMMRDRFTQRNVGRTRRYKTDLWPAEITRIERAFPLFLELVAGNDLGWFGVPG